MTARNNHQQFDYGTNTGDQGNIAVVNNRYYSLSIFTDSTNYEIKGKIDPNAENVTIKGSLSGDSAWFVSEVFEISVAINVAGTFFRVDRTTVDAGK